MRLRFPGVPISVRDMTRVITYPSRDMMGACGKIRCGPELVVAVTTARREGIDTDKYYLALFLLDGLILCDEEKINPKGHIYTTRVKVAWSMVF